MLSDRARLGGGSVIGPHYIRTLEQISRGLQEIHELVNPRYDIVGANRNEESELTENASDSIDAGSAGGQPFGTKSM